MPDCIAEMREAGIKVWMLTGDKLETAENIGYGCKLFTPRTNLFRITDHSTEEILKKLNGITKFIKSGEVPPQSLRKEDHWYVLG